MVVTRKSPGYQVDQRVAIALDALDDEPKRAIGEMIKDRDHFLASLGESRKTRRISEDDPVFALSVPSGLRLIYSRVGDEIVVMDLMHEANLAGYRAPGGRRDEGERDEDGPHRDPSGEGEVASIRPGTTMGQLKTFALSRRQAKAELEAFRALLDGKGQGDLGEASDLLPFFSASDHLCAVMGTYNSRIIDYKNISIAREFSIFGDHKADLVIGDLRNHEFCFIEFEDAKRTSLFNRAAAKDAPDWSPRYEHGFSQLIDWILWLENNRGNTAYKGRFQAAAIRYNALLVIGRDRDLADPALRERFDWRSESIVVASKKVHCITYDKLYDDLKTRLMYFRG